MKPLPERFHATLKTPLGWVAILGTPRGVRHLTLPKSTPEEALDAILAEEGSLGPERPDLLTEVMALLERYYRGEPVDFSRVDIDMEGRSSFYKKIWQTLRDLPRGETVTYGALAARAGHPRAARAVGRAMAANPYPPIVPCHRVIGHGGRLTGFGGGLRLKAALLRMEGVKLQEGREDWTSASTHG